MRTRRLAVWGSTLGMALWALASGGGHVAYAASLSGEDLSRMILIAGEVRGVLGTSWAIRVCADRLALGKQPQGLESAAAATYFSDVPGEELKELKIGLFSFSDTERAKEFFGTGATKTALEVDQVEVRTSQEGVFLQFRKGQIVAYFLAPLLTADKTAAETAGKLIKLAEEQVAILEKGPIVRRDGFKEPLSEGYWKTTDQEAWPVKRLVLGRVTYEREDLQVDLLKLLNSPVGGSKADASLILAKQLIAARLNLENGADPAAELKRPDRAKVSACAATREADRLMLQDFAIVLDSVEKVVYWTDAKAGKISRAGVDGQVVDVVHGLSQPRGLALDAKNGFVYWTDGSGKIQRFKLDFKEPVKDVVPGLSDPWALALDVTNGFVYWTEGSGSGLIQRRKLEEASAPVEKVVTRLTDPRGLALDFDKKFMYWVDAGAGKIQRLKLDDSQAQVQDVVRGLRDPWALALDVQDVNNSFVYWTDGSGKIQRLKLDDSQAQVHDVVPGLSVPHGLALDLTDLTGQGDVVLYWADRGAGMIEKVEVNRETGAFVGEKSSVVKELDLKLPYLVALRSALGQGMATLADQLDRYNNGLAK